MGRMFIHFYSKNDDNSNNAPLKNYKKDQTEINML